MFLHWNRSRVMPWMAAAFLLCASFFAAPGEAQLPTPPPDADPLAQALRTRVREFYSLLQMRRWSQGEAYVAKDSLEDYRYQEHGTFLKFEIKTVELNSDRQSATVVVDLTIFSQFTPTPVPFARKTHWVLEEDEWRVVVPGAAGSDPLESFQPQDETPVPEELKFGGHSYRLGVLQPGEVKAARFPFSNETDHAVTIKEIVTGCECLKVKTEKMQYQPGESGELVIEFDSTGYEYRYAQSVVVTTAPGKSTSYLRISGQVVPRKFAKPQPPAQDPGKP